MRVLLVNPWIHDFSAYDLWIKPLGLLYLAAVLQQHQFELSYIDCLADRYREKADGRAKFTKRPLPTPAPLRNVRRRYGRYGISVEAFRGQLERMILPDMILVTSGMTYWYPGVQETIRELRHMFRDTRIILGGIYATLMPDHAKQCSGADEVISGQCENEIVHLIGAGDASARPYKTLDDYPYPAWNLAGESRYRILMTSRGCPYRCTFCASDILNEQRFIQRQTAAVLKEIEYYYFEQQIREFVFYDDALLIHHRKHLEPLLEQLISRNIRAHFHTPNGLNAREIDPYVARLMFQSGFRTIRISLESASTEIQKHKGNNKVNNEQFREAIQNLYAAGYRAGDVECYLIMGLPGQDMDTVRQSLRFVADLGVIARLATFSPIPGTPEAEEARQVIGDEFLQEPLLQNHSHFPLRNTAITESDLQKLKLECSFNNQNIARQLI